MWYWPNGKHVDKWNRIHSPEINPYSYEQLIFNKDAKTIQKGGNSLFNKWYWATGYPDVK